MYLITKFQFSKLLMAAEAKKLISVDDVAALKKTTSKAIQWQTENLKSFERDFFTGKCQQRDSKTINENSS